MQTQKERSSYTIRELELKVFALQQRAESEAVENSYTFTDDGVSTSQTLESSQAIENALTESCFQEKLQKLNDDNGILEKQVESLEAEKLALTEELDGVKKVSNLSRINSLTREQHVEHYLNSHQIWYRGRRLRTMLRYHICSYTGCAEPSDESRRPLRWSL